MATVAYIYNILTGKERGYGFYNGNGQRVKKM
jgi:hypothetical protein